MVGATKNLLSRAQLLLDIMVVEVALFLCAFIKGTPDFFVYYYPAVISPFLVWLVYSNSAIYRRHPDRMSQAMSIVFAWTKVVVILIVMAFLFKISGLYSRQVIFSWFMIAAPLQVGVHFFVNAWMKKRKGSKVKPSLIVGGGDLSAYLVEHINANPWTAHKIVGVICQSDEEELMVKSIPVLGEFEALRKVVKEKGIKRVYFALHMKSTYPIRDMQLSLIDLNVDIVWAPDIFGLHMVSPSVKEVAGIPLYYLSESPMTEGALLSKILLDKIVASAALLLLSPIMLLAAAAVKATSPGPILFRQERHGLDGKIINVLKFRSMKVHQELASEVSQAVKGDPRLTKVGAFLRKSSIDELPQIINVLKGDMSLVGPRPHAVSHNHFYAKKISIYMSRHRILPGMTGLAQVNGCRGETDTLAKMEKRVEYDLTYINHWSVWLDVRIMIKTVYTLFSKNAY